MAKFAINRPLTTTEPKVVVDAGLPEGRHRFSLVVVNEAGAQSPPDVVVVTVGLKPSGPSGVSRRAKPARRKKS